MITAETLSYPVSIFMAGDHAKALELCRAYCDQIGFCVTVTPTSYVYTGGQETGVIIGLINYPRFPSEPRAIWHSAEQLAGQLRDALGQESYTIQAPDKTVWFSHRDTGGHNAD